jgi:DNA invertase Pin-like site-specific DNA recombinase
VGIVFARISRAVDGSTIKVDHQVELGTESIEERGAQVGEVFTDPSLSAWNPRVVRKNWLRLMERLETDASDGVWVLDATRFSRKPIEGERLIEVAANGAKVWSYSSEYDLTTADGRAAFRAAMTRAAEESDRNSERIRRGKLRRACDGRSDRTPQIADVGRGRSPQETCPQHSVRSAPRPRSRQACSCRSSCSGALLPGGGSGWCGRGVRGVVASSTRPRDRLGLGRVR